ncbi:MAG: CRTAC1 family protein [Myxococcota bacterium]
MSSAWADGGVEFIDIAAGDGAGIDYRRAESPRDDLFDVLKAQPVYTMADVVDTPLKSRGAPGVALLDYDGDGDLDMYISNGPGAANSLYKNLLEQTGTVEFHDVGVASGSDLTDQDSDGVCYGDIDNDGDPDLLVLGAEEPNRLLENQGDGTFADITGLSEIGGGNMMGTSCSFGDVDGDGLLDVVVANAYTDFTQQAPIFVEPYAGNQHNQLFMNEGDGVFTDVSAVSGIQETTGFSPPADGEATITWAIALVDIDQDGDLDLVQADDQAAVAPEFAGGVDRGLIHIFDNDGTGQFTDITLDTQTNLQGQWMSLSFGDLDCNGEIDIFGSNIGDYMPIPIMPFYSLGDSASRWLLQQPDGTFSDPGVGSTVASVFGWGSQIYDYDNDGDDDIIYHGGLDVGPFIEASNAGVVLQNQGCSASFELDTMVASGTDHRRRNVQGLAVGDLDDDGFADVVTVSNLDNPDPIPLVPYEGGTYGSVFDDSAFVPTFAPIGPGEFVFTGIEPEDGTVSVELNSGDNGNNWVKIKAKGMVDIVDGAGVNRDGIGAVISFTPRWGDTSTRPVVDGATYASSHAREQVFGLGSAPRGRLDILWPGGVRNRVYGVRAGKRFTMPEIPCSYDADWPSYWSYRQCVTDSLDDMFYAGEIGPHKWVKLYVSAIWAYWD